MIKKKSKILKVSSKKLLLQAPWLKKALHVFEYSRIVDPPESFSAALIMAASLFFSTYRTQTFTYQAHTFASPAYTSFLSF